MKKVVSLLLSAALLTGVGLPAAQAVEAPADTAYNARASEGVVSEEIGKVRVQVLSPTLVRIEEKGPKGFEDRETFHISNRNDWLGDKVTRTREDGKVVLTTSAYRIVVPERAENMAEVEIYDLEGNRVWNFRKIDTDKVALPDPAEYTEAWTMADSPRVVPAEWGFNEQPSSNRVNIETNGWDLSNDAEDYYVFLPAGDQKKLRKEFVNLTGRTEMLPLYALGAWDSRYYAYSEQTALEQIDGYHSRNLPLDVLVVDTDWRDASSGTGYDINTKLFPDMSGFLSKAHDKNVNIIFNDHPEPTKTGDVQNNVLNPAEVAFRQTNLTNILKLGLDGWWYDRNWWTTIVPPTGFTHEVMGMATYAAAQKAVYPNDRLFMMSNVDGVANGTRTGASNIAAHRYGIQWTGDTSGGQETIWQEIANAVDMGVDSALPYVSTDLGAHMTHDAAMTNTEYLRWMQFGALSPIFRPHVMNVTDFNDGRMPWLRGEETTDTFRDYINLRYRLLPVFYQLSHENYETGMPMLRDMAFDSPEYDEADVSDQYMLGEDILVAPVVDGAFNGIVPAEWFDGGVEASYFKGKDLSGSPVLTQTIDNINFDWGDGSPDQSVPSDNFSARFTGKLTIPGDTATKLSLICDDGCRLWIDGELVIDAWAPHDSAKLMTEKSFEAGKTYDFKLEYFEDAYNAKCQLSSAADTTASAPRKVFIPEGAWIDTLTGKTVYGPQTIDVTCKAKEYPIYIKKGAVIPLADETLTTKDSDWSHLTLDVYPSVGQSDTTEIYEDDTASTQYQEGNYRTTALSSYFDEKAEEAVVEIGAAQGGFDGPLAFDNRDYTLRVHQPEGWGALRKVLVGGKEVAFQTTAADKEAMPLLNEGGSRDGAVYTVDFPAQVQKGETVRLQFENPADPAVPAGDYCTPNYYGRPAPVAVTRDIQVENTVPEKVNLTAEGTADWVHGGYPENGGIVRKAGVESRITFKNAKGAFPMLDYRAKMSWTDGDAAKTVTDTQRGLQNKGQGDAYEFVVDAGQGEQTLTLYLGGWRSTSKLEVFDETGGKTDTYEWGDGSQSYYRKVTIKLKADSLSPLHVRYSLESGDNSVFTAATLGDAPTNGDGFFISAGNYQSGKWTRDTVKIGLTAGKPENVKAYQVKVGDGAWTALAKPEYRVELDGEYALQFRCLDKQDRPSEVRSITVRKNGAVPDVPVTAEGLTGQWTAQAVDFKAGTPTEGSVLYYQTDGGMWRPLDGGLDGAGNGIYRFKAVSATGVESPVRAFRVLVDSVKPTFKVTAVGDLGTPTSGPVAFTLKATSDNLSPLTFYYATEGENWTAMEGSTLAVSAPGKRVYRFKAVSAAGLESDVSEAYTVEITEVEFLLGDMNRNGSIDIIDVMECCRVLARRSTGTLPDEDEIRYGDMNGDGDVTITDVMALCKVLASKVQA